MKRRIIATLLVIGSISGCISTNDPELGGPRPNYGRSFGPPAVPGVMGPYGENVPMAPPYSNVPPGSKMAAMNMMGNSVPLSMVHMHPNGMMTPPGVVGMPGTMPGMPGVPSPGAMPGGMPGMPGPMPGMPPMGGNPFQKTSLQGMMPNSGVVNANVPPGGPGPGGVSQAQFAGPSGPLFPQQRTQVFFTKPAGMKIFWVSQGADGKPSYSPTPLETPGRFNFAQAAIYRLKLEKIPGRPGQELYPTLEVVPTSPKTSEFLAHNSVPVEFTEDDFKQVFDRNYIVKVIYLPSPEFQDAAGAGPDEIVSTRLEPGQDPIQEALRRGSILLVLRIGNIDQGLQHSPATTAPVPGGPPALIKPPGQGVPPLFQFPYPVQPIAPGGTPNPLPPIGQPKQPDGKLELIPDPKDKKGEKAPDPFEKKGEKLLVPPFELPAPPGSIGNDGAKPNLPLLPLPPKVQPNDKPFAPAPNLQEKGLSVVPKDLPVIPASTNKSAAPQLPSVSLPVLPSLDGSRPDLTPLPALPGGGKK